MTESLKTQIGPFALQANGFYRKQCGRCSGTGSYWLVNENGTYDGGCWSCNATGVIGKFVTAAYAEARVIANEKAAARREAKAAAEWEAGREEREARAAAEEAARIAREAEDAKFSHLNASIGETVTITGVVTAAVTIDTQFGASRIVTIVDADNHEIKMFTTATWAWNIDRDETATITGSVKDFSEYNGRPQTTLTRPKRVA